MFLLLQKQIMVQRVSGMCNPLRQVSIGFSRLKKEVQNKVQSKILCTSLLFWYLIYFDCYVYVEREAPFPIKLYYEINQHMLLYSAVS